MTPDELTLDEARSFRPRVPESMAGGEGVEAAGTDA